MNPESQSFNIDFLGANRQFDWLGISLTFYKSNRHNTIYDSYNVEKAATFIKSIALENIFEACSLMNQMKFDTLNKTQKYLLYKQFVLRNCDGCLIVPITDYVNNPTFQELSLEEKYFS